MKFLGTTDEGLFTPLPMELVQKCNQTIRETHRLKGGAENLSKKIVGKGLKLSRQMVSLGVVPAGLQLMGSIYAVFKLRVFTWIVGIAVLIASFIFGWWLLLLLLPVAIADRKLKSDERGFYMFEASILLA